jgi:hypothetical protein
MSKEVLSFELLMEVFRRTLELTKKSTDYSLEIIEKELEDNSNNIESDHQVMLRIIKKHLDDSRIKI